MLMKNLNTKSNEELLKLVDDLKAELFMLRFQNSTGQLENPHKIPLVKKDIAKAFTAMNTNDKEKAKAKEKNAKPEVSKKEVIKPATKATVKIEPKTEAKVEVKAPTKAKVEVKPVDKLTEVKEGK